MFENAATHFTEPRTRGLDDRLELSVVDAVLWACDQSEDETEVGDLVDAALQRAGVHAVPEAPEAPHGSLTALP